MAKVTKINVEEFDYFIGSDASIITFNNTNSDLVSTNVQDATEEINDKVEPLTNIANKFIDSTRINLFDKRKKVDDYLVSRLDGELKPSSTVGASFTTDYIPIDEAGCYAALAKKGGTYLGYACYNSEKVFTHGYSNEQATYQEGDAYVRYSGAIAQLDEFMVIRGTSSNYPNEYIPYNYLESEFKTNIIGEEQLKDNSISASKLKDDISVNNLTTNDSVRPLSAAQGKVIADATMDLVIGTNLLNPDTIEVGRYVNRNTGVVGDISNPTYNATYGCTPLIPLTEDIICISCMNKSGQGVAAYVAYDENGDYITFLDKTTNPGSAIAVSKTDNPSYAYVRFNLYPNENNQYAIYKGSTLPSEFIPYAEPYWIMKDGRIADNSVSTTKLVDSAVTPDKANFFEIIYSKNLCNPNDPDFKLNVQITSTSGNEYSWAGTEHEGRVGCTGYIPISENGLILNHYGSLGNTSGMAVYDSDKKYIRGDRTNIYTYVECAGDAYIRFTFDYDYKDSIQVEEGSVITNYVPYSADRKIKPEYIPDIDISSYVPPKKFNCLTAKGIIDASGVIYTSSINISKNCTYVGRVKGTIENVCFGVGYTNGNNKRLYAASWLELTQTQAILHRYYTSTTTEDTQTLPSEFIDNDTTVVVSTTIDSTSNSTYVQCVSKIQIFNSKGDIFEYTTKNKWGVGRPFIENNGTQTIIDAEVKFFPKDLTKSIWMFGDSYFSYNDANRWPYYYFRDLYFGTLYDNKAGEKPDEGISDLTTLLGMGYVPSIVVWCHGMNGGGTEEKVNDAYTINSYQKTYIDTLISLSHEYGFDVVISTIPTTPRVQRTGYNNYIKTLGCRIIDFADAVGTDEDGIWHNSPTLFAWRNETLAATIYTSKSIDKVLDTNTANHIYNSNGSVNDNYTIESKDETNNEITVSYNNSSYVFSALSSSDIIGHISSDMVHPTQTGAKVLYSRVLADCPEITINE